MTYGTNNWDGKSDPKALLWPKAYEMCAAIRAIATIPNNTKVSELSLARNYLDHQLSDVIVALGTSYGTVWANYDKMLNDRAHFEAEARIKSGVYDDAVTNRAARNSGKSAASLVIRGGIIEKITFNLGTGLPDGVYMLETK